MSKLRYDLTHFLTPWLSIVTGVLVLATLFYVPFIFAAIIMGLATFLFWLMESGTRPTYKPPMPKDRFCEDCGQKLIEKPWQDGFDTKTGKPNMRVTIECPDREDALDAYRATSMISPYISGPRCGPYARLPKPKPRSKPLTSASVSSVYASFSAASVMYHNHTDPTKVMTNCTLCVNTMVANGIIDQETANSLLA